MHLRAPAIDATSDFGMNERCKWDLELNTHRRYTVVVHFAFSKHNAKVAYLHVSGRIAPGLGSSIGPHESKVQRCHVKPYPAASIGINAICLCRALEMYLQQSSFFKTYLQRDNSLFFVFKPSYKCLVLMLNVVQRRSRNSNHIVLWGIQHGRLPPCETNTSIMWSGCALPKP